MASKKPRKKQAPAVDVVVLDVPPTKPPTAVAQKPPHVHINPKDLMPHGLYKQIQELKDRLKRIETLLENENK